MKKRVPKIAIEHIGLTEGDGSDRDVAFLEDISLEVCAGEFVCLIGPRGCGASGLLHIAAGLLQPTQGEIRIDGVVVRGPNAGQILISQQDGVFPWLNVE